MTISILIDKYDNRSQLPGETEAKKWVEIKDSDICLELAMKANDVRDEDEVVLFINLDVCTGSLNENGATLLEYIRFAENLPNGTENQIRDAHCVLFSSLYSFETTVRKYPEQTILYSPGTTFLGPVTQDPFDVDVDQLSQELFDKRNWVQTVRKSTFIETDNHSIANWWGVHKLAQVHSAVTGTTFQVDEIKPELEKLKNLRAITFYSSANSDFTQLLGSEKLKQIKTLRSQVSNRSLKILHIDDEWEKGWSRIFAHILFGDNVEEQDTQGAFKIYRSKGKGEIGVLKTFPSYPEFGRAKFAEEIFKKISMAIETWSPDCILLDLRLAGSYENDIPVDQMSGVQLVRKLRDKLKGIPVVMTTASNKARSIAKLLNLGADAYWIKEGFDGSSRPFESIENYKRLLELVENASGDRYKFLSRFAKGVESHLQNNNRWYYAPHWNKGNTTITNKNKKRIKNILDETVSLLRSYLHASVMGYEYRSDKSERHLISSLVTHSFHIIEIIHNPSNLKFDPVSRTPFTISTPLNNRNDHFGNQLRKIRNQYAHLDFLFGDASQIATFDSLRRYLIGLIAYLEVSPKNCKSINVQTDLLQVEHYEKAIKRFSC